MLSEEEAWKALGVAADDQQVLWEECVGSESVAAAQEKVANLWKSTVLRCHPDRGQTQQQQPRLAHITLPDFRLDAAQALQAKEVLLDSVERRWRDAAVWRAEAAARQRAEAERRRREQQQQLDAIRTILGALAKEQRKASAAGFNYERRNGKPTVSVPRPGQQAAWERVPLPTGRLPPTVFPGTDVEWALPRCLDQLVAHIGSSGKLQAVAAEAAVAADAAASVVQPEPALLVVAGGQRCSFTAAQLASGSLDLAAAAWQPLGGQRSAATSDGSATSAVSTDSPAEDLAVSTDSPAEDLSAGVGKAQAQEVDFVDLSEGSRQRGTHDQQQQQQQQQQQGRQQRRRQQSQQQQQQTQQQGQFALQEEGRPCSLPKKRRRGRSSLGGSSSEASGGSSEASVGSSEASGQWQQQQQQRAQGRPSRCQGGAGGKRAIRDWQQFVRWVGQALLGRQQVEVQGVAVEVEMSEQGICYRGKWSPLSSFALALIRERKNPERKAASGWETITWRGQKLRTLYDSLADEALASSAAG